MVKSNGLSNASFQFNEKFYSNIYFQLKVYKPFLGLASLNMRPQYNHVIVQTMYFCEILTTYNYLVDKSFLPFIRLFDLTVIRFKLSNNF